MNQHEWFTDRIAEYLAGGLTDAERAQFEAHRVACEACASEFDTIEQTEKTMTQLFGAVVPASDFEDRLIGRLRLRGPRLRIHPIVRRAALAAAVTIVLGGFGYVADRQMRNGGLSFNRTKDASNLREIGQATVFGLNENKTQSNYGFELAPLNAPSSNAEKWDFGAGKNTQLNWSDGTQKPASDSPDKNGQHVFYGDKRVEFQQNPFSGEQRDSTFARKRFAEISSNAPINADDSVRLPLDSESDRSLSKAQPSERQLVRLQEGVTGTFAGENTFRGGVAINGSVVTGKPVGGPVILGKGVVTDSSGGAKALDARDYYFKPASNTLSDASILPGVRAEVERRVSLGVEPQLVPAQAGAPVRAGGNQIGDQDGDKTKVAEGQPVADQPPAKNPPAQNAAEPEHAPATQESVRKVIRNGDIEFEIDSFDSATVTITKIALEEKGYIATTNSQKLPNGKVKGVIVVRVPPDHLDMLVLKLRALGDLKSQNLTAQDVTKQYTDSASELRAARAMEERLISIIKNSQGAIKDLLAAEKELAVWREKIEKLEGALRYYDSLVSLSTLNISLFERDIKKADVLKETENVDMGVETDDVEAKRAAAIKAIDDAKGRIVESELKKLDAGQLAAKVVADIPPDAAGPAIDRLKQLGKIARLEIHRSQKSSNDQPASADTKLQRGDTRLVLSLYNLANVAPRQTSNLNLAAADVEEAYNTILSRVIKSDGRIVTSNLNRQTDQQTSGVIQFEVKSADADVILDDVRKTGEVTRLTVAENPDTNNVTAAKRGFSVSIVSLSSLQPREVNNRSIASADVDKSYASIIESLRKAGARVIVSRVEDAGRGQHNGYIDFEIPRAQMDAIEKALGSAGETYNRSVNAAAAADNVTDAKVQYKLAVSPASSLPPRQSDALAVEVADVDAAAQSFQSSAITAGGRVIDSSFSKDANGQTARIVVEVPYASAQQTVAQAKQLGTVRGSQQATNQHAPSGELARARIELTLASGDALVSAEHGFIATLRNGLSTSFAGLMWSLQLIVIGLCLIGPWAALIWLGVKLVKRARRRTSTPVA